MGQVDCSGIRSHQLGGKYLLPMLTMLKCRYQLSTEQQNGMKQGRNILDTPLRVCLEQKEMEGEERRVEGIVVGIY